MSQASDSTGLGPSNVSTDVSPTDTRNPSRRFESITHDDDEETATTTGTVRRNRPPAITTDSVQNYGTFPPRPFRTKPKSAANRRRLRLHRIE